MEMAQGNSMYSCLKPKKRSVFCFCFFTKLENRRAEHVLSRELILVGGERMWRKGEGG
jgi:Zn-finger protein